MEAALCSVQLPVYQDARVKRRPYSTRKFQYLGRVTILV